MGLFGIELVEEVFRQEAVELGAEVEVQHKIFLEAYKIEEDDTAFLKYKEVLKKHHIEPCYPVFLSIQSAEYGGSRVKTTF